ncbi:putative lexA/Signal peptidase-like superfamily [Helianthus annuus]|nr:putative lexA/Signal peptidase-like superfamily [Helianthus annuus]
MVHGPSMLPTFDLTNEIVLLDRISTRHGNAGPNDVVILQSPENPKTFVTKRNIGVEDVGEFLETGRSERRVITLRSNYFGGSPE